jgi:hypothetical protein
MRLKFGDAKDDGNGHWVVAMTRVHDDGSTEEGSHVFPKDALEWRAAEYGIDPADRDTLLDIILTEPHLSEEDRAVGPDLANADTVDEARAAHITRCAKVKLQYRMSTRLPALDRVRDESPMNPEALEIKRNVVHEGREVQRRVRKLVALRAIDPEAERLRKLREAHRVPHHTRRAP